MGREASFQPTYYQQPSHRVKGPKKILDFPNKNSITGLYLDLCSKLLLSSLLFLCSYCNFRTCTHCQRSFQSTDRLFMFPTAFYSCVSIVKIIVKKMVCFAHSSSILYRMNHLVNSPCMLQTINLQTMFSQTATLVFAVKMSLLLLSGSQNQVHFS